MPGPSLVVGPYLMVYLGLVGFFTFASIYHLVLWSAGRRQPLLAVFSFDCALRAVLSGVLVALMSATTPEAAFQASWARIALVMLTFIATIWGVRLISGVRAPRVVWALTGLSAAAFGIHTFVVPLNTPVLSVNQLVMPWGERIADPVTSAPGWWVGPLFLLGFAIQVFALYCGGRLWQRDRTAGGYVVLATVGTLVVFLLEALRTFHLAGAPILGAFPNVLWVGAIALVIARDHRHTRRQLAASEQRFRGIFDQSFQFIGLLRTDGVVIETNRTSLEFAGARAEEVIGKPFWETPWWSHSPAVQRQLQAAITAAAAGEMVRFEATHPRPDGSLADVDVSIKPVRDTRGRVTLLIPEGRDITERKESEEKQRALEGQLAQAQKMEAIGQVAGGVAHDFNNLLTVINGYSEILLSSTPPDDARHAMVEDIHDAGTRAAALTRQLLMFTRRQVVEPQELDLNAVVVENERMLRRLIGEDLRLETNLAAGLARVRADPGQLSQVILNLAVNARDATPPGGRLVIRTENVDVDATGIRAAAGEVRSGRHVVLAVTDTGHGMAPAVQARVFEPFFTTKAHGKGTGMGLATVRTIAEQCEGFLTVHSAPDEGSEFRFYLPARGEPLEVKPLERDVASLPGHVETILLVEDDDAVRTLTRQMLRTFGYTVLEAPGAERAELLARQHPGTIDLLVTDVVMPEVGGRELAERVTGIRPGLKVLYMSGYAADAGVRHGVLESDVAFLQKPFSVEALASKVRQVLDAGG